MNLGKDQLSYLWDKQLTIMCDKGLNNLGGLKFVDLPNYETDVGSVLHKARRNRSKRT